jgi:hypothetical protein
MTYYGARIIAHKLPFDHPNYHQIHLAAIRAYFQQYTIVDGAGVQHRIFGMYQSYLPISSLEEAKEKLTFELEPLGFPMDVEVFLVKGEAAWTINDNPYSRWGELLGLYAVSRNENNTHEVAWLNALTGFTK